MSGFIIVKLAGLAADKIKEEQTALAEEYKVWKKSQSDVDRKLIEGKFGPAFRLDTARGQQI